MKAGSQNEIRAYQIELRDPSDLPKDFKAYAECYSKPESDIYIRPELRHDVAVIIGKPANANKNELYILFISGNAGDGEASRFARNFVQISKSSAMRFNVEKLNVAKISESSRVIEHINDQVRNNNTVKSSSKTSSDVAFTEEILLDAFRQNASDVHVESQGNGMAIVRARVNKELHLLRWITQKEAETFGSVCYGTFSGNLEDKGTARGTYKSSSLLEGIFQRKIMDQQTGVEAYIKGRMLNLAHNHENNSDFIIRIIDKNKNNKAKRFTEMGFSEHASKMLRKLETITSGAILTCGVTGSGKSTTQTNMVQHERDRSGGKRKIILIEDPVEYNIDLVTQITVGIKKEDTPEDNDFSFDNINTRNMRADPDSLGYGEIRDISTTKNMIKGALTGHLVYGTIHTSGALEVFERLHDFGASMADLCRENFLRVILFQHLLPKLCPHCSIPYRPGDPTPEKYGELFVAKLHLSNDMKITAAQITACQQEAKRTDSSLFRVMQRKGIINAATVKDLVEKKNMLNESSDQDAFLSRLTKITEQSLYPVEKMNIRFRGNGCKHCLDGQIGVAPAAEILIPDSRFLELIKAGQKTKAKLYWRTMLNGLTAAEDCYGRIFTGHIDPRSVEEHLGDLGE